MFICEEDIRRKDRCYSVTENFFGIMKSELLNAKIQKGIRTGSQLLTRPTFWVHFMNLSPMILESVVPVPMIRENNKKFLEISEFKNVIVILLFC